MLLNYTSIMRQAEKLSTEEVNLYPDAINILSNNKVERFSDVISDVDQMLNLMIIELDNNKKVENENLLFGCQFVMDEIFKKYDLIKQKIALDRNNLYKLNHEDSKTLNDNISIEATNIKEKYSEYYDITDI